MDTASLETMTSAAQTTAEPSARGTQMSRRAAFWAVAATLTAFTAASSAPSPLYVVYQQAWGFSASTLTGVFAIYVVGLLGSLLTFGALSDHVGRRPVLGAAITLEAVSLGLFLVAGDVTVLAIARLLQGIATGAAVTTLGAALVDLNPAHAPTRAGVVNGVAPLSGLAVGALGCGALVQLAPAPTHLVFWVLLAGMAAAGALVAVMPETTERRPGGVASLVPSVGIPEHLRRTVLGVVPVLVASWALGGLYLSLGPSLAAQLFGLDSHLIGGLVVTLLCGTGAATAFLLRARPGADVLHLGSVLLALGCWRRSRGSSPSSPRWPPWAPWSREWASAPPRSGASGPSPASPRRTSAGSSSRRSTSSPTSPSASRRWPRASRRGASG